MSQNSLIPSLPGGILATLDAQRDSKRRILWVAGNYYPDIGGGEVSLQANVCLLKRDFGQLVLSSSSHGCRVIDGIPILESEGSSLSGLNEVLDYFQPDYVATQGMFSRLVMEAVSERQCGLVYFLRALTDMNFSRFLDRPDFKVVANSEWVSEWFFEKWNARPILLHPVVIPWMAIARERSPEYITHVGDINVKGGERIYKLAQKFVANSNSERFLVTKSWPALRGGNNTWDMQKINLLRSTEGSTTAFEAQILDFTELPNVVYREPFLDPKALYAQTKLLLFASKWREPFGRVILEAILNRIPVILSAEAFDRRWEGLVYKVNNSEDIDEWYDISREVLANGIEPSIAAAIEDFVVDIRLTTRLRY